MGSSPLYEKEALDALCIHFNLNKLSYEEILSLMENTSNAPKLRGYLQKFVSAREQEIREQVDDLSLENLKRYVQHFPNRKFLVDDYLASTLGKSLKDLSFLELAYVNSTLPEFQHTAIESEMSTRMDERHNIMSKNVGKFIQSERKESDQIRYMLELITWSYFVEAHKQLTTAYSQIGMVSDDAYIASSQYQNLMRACFNPTRLQDMLQTQVNKYCEQINKARKDYADMAGKKSYVKMSYKVPTGSIYTNVYCESLWNIAKARRDFLENRQTSNSISGVAGFFLGGLVGLITKGIGDYVSISSLADDEYEARLQHVQVVHDALRDNFQRYTNDVITGFNNALTKNEKDYENDIKK